MGQPEGDAVVNEELPTTKLKPCRFCANKIPRAASKCTHCDTWQNWRGALNLSIPVLSLVLAILTVVFSSGREFYEYVFYEPMFDAVIADITYTASPLRPADLKLRVVNDDKSHILLHESIWCEAYNIDNKKGGLRVHFLRLYNPDGQLDASTFAISGESHRIETFHCIEIENEGTPLTEVIQRLSKVRYECAITYSYDGRSYTIHRQGIGLASAS